MKVKGPHGFVGLMNLGSTCYINSLLQQFFMISRLRHEILNSDLSFANTPEFAKSIPQQYQEKMNLFLTEE